ncbi:hypothetical protein KCP76_19550 [Salmonella enterica subsp. enterica serovar Weltevreden]|nr:hypothetical protein KCP76_19550 [Salmonella enterica subsp. enterica serovar Weltevreden]
MLTCLTRSKASLVPIYTENWKMPEDTPCWALRPMSGAECVSEGFAIVLDTARKSNGLYSFKNVLRSLEHMPEH